MSQESLHPQEAEVMPEAADTAAATEARRAVRKKLREDGSKSVQQMGDYRKETKH